MSCVVSLLKPFNSFLIIIIIIIIIIIHYIYIALFSALKVLYIERGISSTTTSGVFFFV